MPEKLGTEIFKKELFHLPITSGFFSFAFYLVFHEVIEVLFLCNVYWIDWCVRFCVFLVFITLQV